MQHMLPLLCVFLFIIGRVDALRKNIEGRARETFFHHVPTSFTPSPSPLPSPSPSPPPSKAVIAGEAANPFWPENEASIPQKPLFVPSAPQPKHPDRTPVITLVTGGSFSHSSDQSTQKIKETDNPKGDIKRIVGKTSKQAKSEVAMKKEAKKKTKAKQGSKKYAETETESETESESEFTSKSSAIGDASSQDKEMQKKRSQPKKIWNGALEGVTDTRRGTTSKRTASGFAEKPRSSFPPKDGRTLEIVVEAGGEAIFRKKILPKADMPLNMTLNWV